jgi:hypothetical protein
MRNQTLVGFELEPFEWSMNFFQQISNLPLGQQSTSNQLLSKLKLIKKYNF